MFEREAFPICPAGTSRSADRNSLSSQRPAGPPTELQGCPQPPEPPDPPDPPNPPPFPADVSSALPSQLLLPYLLRHVSHPSPDLLQSLPQIRHLIRLCPSPHVQSSVSSLDLAPTTYQKFKLHLWPSLTKISGALLCFTGNGVTSLIICISIFSTSDKADDKRGGSISSLALFSDHFLQAADRNCYPLRRLFLMDLKRLGNKLRPSRVFGAESLVVCDRSPLAFGKSFSSPWERSLPLSSFFGERYVQLSSLRGERSLSPQSSVLSSAPAAESLLPSLESLAPTTTCKSFDLLKLTVLFLAGEGTTGLSFPVSNSFFILVRRCTNLGMAHDSPSLVYMLLLSQNLGYDASSSSCMEIVASQTSFIECFSKSSALTALRLIVLFTCFQWQKNY